MFFCGAAQIELSFKLCLLKGVRQILVRRWEETNLAVIGGNSLRHCCLDFVSALFNKRDIQHTRSRKFKL